MKRSAYEVGYGKPPAQTRFKAGASGNPGGRPRGMTAERAKKLALKEAYRLITIREGEKVITLPAFQAIMRQLVRLAAKGSSPAQRLLIELVRTIEQEETIRAESEADRTVKFQITRTIVDHRTVRSESDAREGDVQNSRDFDNPQNGTPSGCLWRKQISAK